MTRDDIIRAGVESGLLEPGHPIGERVAGELERFAALVAASEREACEKLEYEAGIYSKHDMAAAIRARGQQ